VPLLQRHAAVKRKLVKNAELESVQKILDGGKYSCDLQREIQIDFFLLRFDLAVASERKKTYARYCS